MKELTQEEKARAYDEAIEKLDVVLNLSTVKESGTISVDDVRKIFPELKESEDDRIRNFICNELACLRATDEKGSDRYEELTNAIAWLEKQGEQKPFDYKNANIQHKDFAPKTESKFKVGDWVVFNNKHQSIYQVEKIEDGYYILRHTHGGTFRVCVLHDESLRLWTIKDAKTGDILSDGTTIFIFKDLLSDGSMMSYCDYDTGSGESDAFCPLSMNLMCPKITPATKGQHDTLMKAMTDAGYTFDFEKKELKKIENEIEIPFGAKDSELQEATYYIPKVFYAKIEDDMVVVKKGEKKPAEWSKEDLAMLDSAIAFVEHSPFTTIGKGKNNVIVWLKSLKDRVCCETGCITKQAWKQENTGDLTEFESAMMHIGDSFFGQHSGLDPNDTNAIKEQANLLLELVPSKEWSKDDERIYQSIIDDTVQENQLDFKQINWLRNIKYRNQWKPSGEQVKQLGWIAKQNKDNMIGKELMTLYNDLKKLKE